MAEALAEGQIHGYCDVSWPCYVNEFTYSEQKQQ